MLGQPRTAQRRARKVVSDEGALRGDIVRLASRFGRYGYRMVTGMLRAEGEDRALVCRFLLMRYYG